MWVNQEHIDNVAVVGRELFKQFPANYRNIKSVCLTYSYIDSAWKQTNTM